MQETTQSGRWFRGSRSRRWFLGRQASASASASVTATSRQCQGLNWRPVSRAELDCPYCGPLVGCRRSVPSGCTHAPREGVAVTPRGTDVCASWFDLVTGERVSITWDEVWPYI